MSDQKTEKSRFSIVEKIMIQCKGSMNGHRITKDLVYDKLHGCGIEEIITDHAELVYDPDEYEGRLHTFDIFLPKERLWIDFDDTQGVVCSATHFPRECVDLISVVQNEFLVYIKKGE